METLTVHRPRNVDWKRAAALLYGDWGTSKAYVIGLAFVAAGYASLPIILAVCILTAVVAYNYVIICRNFPDGGGVYSAARDQSRFLAVMGALLLVADLTVTASLSAWTAMSYFGVPSGGVALATVGCILVLGAMNAFGPRHSGSLAVSLAIPMVAVVAVLILLSLPYLTWENFEPSHDSFTKNWIAFVGVILALSGVEAIANLTGVMRLDSGATMDKPQVGQTARRSIWLVAAEVTIGTALLGWAMLSLPKRLAPELVKHQEDMLRFMGEQYGALWFGPFIGHGLGVAIGIVVGLLLLSAVNTAIVALIGLLYMLARDGEMPKTFARLNSHGVPWVPLIVASLLPSIVVMLTSNFEALAGLYAIGVVGAIAVNLGSCTFNPRLGLSKKERFLMGGTFLLLFAIEMTIAKTKHDALFFCVCVLGIGFGLRGYAQRRAGMQTVLVHKEVAEAVSPEVMARLKLKLDEGTKIMVAARGLTPVLRYAMEEARLRKATLYVLYIKELAVAMPASLGEATQPRWQDDPQASGIMCGVIELGKGHHVPVLPLYAISKDPASTIIDLAATIGVDFLILGASNRRFLTNLLKGDIIDEVARDLPESIQLLIHG